MKVFESVTLNEIHTVAEYLVSHQDNRNLWAFYGEMGAGKTTLIKAICELLKVKSEVSSPTFSLVNEYHNQAGETVYHFDFYRILDLEEVYQIGYEEYFYSGNLCLIEWPEKIDPLLFDDEVLKIRIEKADEDSRRVSIDI